MTSAEKSARYRLVAIDLDGTLLHSDHQVSPVNAEALRQVEAQGIFVNLTSGRRYGTIAAFANKIGLPPASLMTAYNGALIRTLGGDTLFHQPVSAALAEVIVRECASQELHLNYYLDDTLYIRDMTLWAAIYQKRTGTVPQSVGDLTRFDGCEPTKLLIIDTPAKTDRLLTIFQKRFGSSLYITKTEDEYLEFMHPAVSKGRALAFGAAHLGYSAAECVAFGDSYNDISMLEWAGLSIAMGNARAEVKAISARIAPTADEDGVAAVLTELFLSQV